MLPADHRLVDSASFRRASKLGRKGSSRLLTTHLLVDDAQAHAPRVGFVVSRAVGTAVRRNRVKRRLRHAVRARLDALPRGSVLVVRAHAVAGAASYAELVVDLDRCLRRSLQPRPTAQASR